MLKVFWNENNPVQSSILAEFERESSSMTNDKCIFTSTGHECAEVNGIQKADLLLCSWLVSYRRYYKQVTAIVKSQQGFLRLELLPTRSVTNSRNLFQNSIQWGWINEADAVCFPQENGHMIDSWWIRKEYVVVDVTESISKREWLCHHSVRLD